MKTSALSLRSVVTTMLFAAPALFWGGCQSVIQPPKDTVALAKEQITAINGVSGSIHSLEKSVTKDPDTSAKRIAELDEKIAQSEARAQAAVEDANSQNEKLKQKLAGVTADLAQIASAFSGLGPIVPGLLSATQEALKERVGKVDDHLKDTLQKEITGLRDDVAKKIGDQVKLDETQLARFRTELMAAAKEQKLSQAELDKLNGMSDAELLGLLGGGGSLAGVALTALARTLGPSRGKQETDELKGKVEDMRVQKATMEARINSLEKKA